MRWFRKPSLKVVVPAQLRSPGEARALILARLAHRAGPPWHERYGDPLAWLEQIYYDTQDEPTRTYFTDAVIALLSEPGARWAALTLVRTLRLSAATPALMRLAASGELCQQPEGQCADLQLYLIVALEELGARAAIPFLQSQLTDPIYAVSACLALLRMGPDLAISGLPSVAAASSQAAEGSSGMLGSIGAVLATPLRNHDPDTFLAMVHALEGCDRSIRLHAADALRRQIEIEGQPDLEAAARRLLLQETRSRG